MEIRSKTPKYPQQTLVSGAGRVHRKLPFGVSEDTIEKVLVGGIVAGHFLAAAMARREPLSMGCASLGLYFAQQILLGFWTVIGRGPAWLRLFVAGAGVGLTWLWLARLANLWTITAYPFALFAAGGVVALLMRHGHKLRARLHRSQLQSRELLLGVTIAALAIWSRHFLAEHAGDLAENAVAAAVGAWVAFQDGMNLRRSSVAILAAFWQPGMYAFEYGINPDSGWECTAAMSTTRIAVLIATFWMLKQAGYMLWTPQPPIESIDITQARRNELIWLVVTTEIISIAILVYRLVPRTRR